MHGAIVAGEAALAVSLADSLFLSVSPDAARSKVLLFLIFSFTPFIVLSGLIGPFLDKVPGGRRLTVVGVAVLRAVVVIMMIRWFDSLVLFPLAFASLVLAKVYAVSRSAMMPMVVRSDNELMAANGRIGRLTGIMGFVAGVPAALLHLIDSRVSLGASAVAFLIAAVLAFTMLPRTAAAPNRATSLEEEELHRPAITRARFAIGSLRVTSGFMLLHLAFWLRDQKAGTAWFGLALAVGSASTLVANSLGSVIKRMKLSEHSVLVGSLGIVALVGWVAAYFGNITAGIVLAGVVNGFGATGKLAFDSIVQSNAPDANRSRAFAKYETRNQLAQVAGGLVAVVLLPSGAVGFVMVAIYASLACAYYFYKY